MSRHLILLLLVLCGLSLVSANPPYPSKTYVNLVFNSISKVDGVAQSFAADFYMTTYWMDDTFDPNITANFDPQVEFQNSQGDVTTQSPNAPYIGSPSATVLGVPTSGHQWIVNDQRYVGDFNTKLQLSDFPFDKQDVVLAIESSVYTNDIVVFVPVFNLTAKMLPANIQIVEWTILGTEVNQQNNYYPNFDQTYSHLEIRVHLARQSGYYVWKIFLGSILLVIMAIAVFALKIDEADRMMGTITIFLALISFLFVAGSSIPKIAYQTRLDNFMNFSFFMVFFILMAHAGIYSLRLSLPVRISKPYKVKKSSEGKMEVEEEESPDGFEGFHKIPLGRKLDFICMAVFGIIYIIGVPCILYGPTPSH